MKEKFIEAVHKKKAETEPDYKGENPGTVQEAIKDLKEMGVINEKEQKPFAEKDAENIVKTMLGKDVFERQDKKIEPPKDKSENKQKPYVYREIDRLGKELVEFLKKARETKNMEAKKVYEERAKFFRMELEKAKAVRDKIKEAKTKKPTELQADIRGAQSKNYGKSNIYTKGSTPEDALEEELRLKNLRGIDKKNT
jgi:hypothetical protein